MTVENFIIQFLVQVLVNGMRMAQGHKNLFLFDRK